MPCGGSIVPFGKLCVFVKLVPDEYPSGVLTVSDLLSSSGGNVSSDINDLCVRVEVLTIGSSTSISRARRVTAMDAATAAATGQSDPLLATVQSLRTPIIPNADPATAGAELDASRKLLLAEATELAVAWR